MQDAVRQLPFGYVLFRSTIWKIGGASILENFKEKVYSEVLCIYFKKSVEVFVEIKFAEIKLRHRYFPWNFWNSRNIHFVEDLWRNLFAVVKQWEILVIYW